MERFSLPVEISALPDGGYVASCPILEGCHAEGRTPDEAVEHMEEIAKAVLTKSPYMVLAHPHSSPIKAWRRCPIL